MSTQPKAIYKIKNEQQKSTFPSRYNTKTHTAEGKIKIRNGENVSKERAEMKTWESFHRWREGEGGRVEWGKENVSSAFSFLAVSRDEWIRFRLH
jgi:hypothetical protein